MYLFLDLNICSLFCPFQQKIHFFLLIEQNIVWIINNVIPKINSAHFLKGIENFYFIFRTKNRKGFSLKFLFCSIEAFCPRFLEKKKVNVLFKFYKGKIFFVIACESLIILWRLFILIFQFFCFLDKLFSFIVDVITCDFQWNNLKETNGRILSSILFKNEN